MRLRNGSHGYGAVTRALHWLTVALLAAQFAVGYAMEADGDVADVDCDPPGERRSGGDTTDAEEERLDRLEERCEDAQDLREERAEDQVGTAWDDLGGGLLDGGVSLPEAHVLLGLLVLVLATVRLAWRRTTPLPPWDPRLGAAGRRWLHLSEVVLMTLLFVVPISGIALVVGADDLVGLHIAAHVAFFVALAAHLAVVLGRGLLPRMLPGGRAA